MIRLLYVLVVAVGAAAAVLSFDALQHLATQCGFTSNAWLFPVTVDAGAAAGTVAWVRAAGPARAFGRTLALALLTVSVSGNAVGHLLEVPYVSATWLFVVVVSATVPPAVLGAVVHLLVLLADPASAGTTTSTRTSGRSGPEHLAGKKARPVRRRPRHTARRTARPRATPRRTRIGLRPPGRPAIAAVPSAGGDRATGLIAAGLGRRRLAAALGISQHAAREMLRGARPSGVAA